MALFYDGVDPNPKDEIVEADTFHIIRMGIGFQGDNTATGIVEEIRRHFKGNVSDERIQRAIESLRGKMT